MVEAIGRAMGFGFSLPILQREARKLILKREQADGSLAIKAKSAKS